MSNPKIGWNVCVHAFFPYSAVLYCPLFSFHLRTQCERKLLCSSVLLLYGFYGNLSKMMCSEWRFMRCGVITVQEGRLMFLLAIAVKGSVQCSNKSTLPVLILWFCCISSTCQRKYLNLLPPSECTESQYHLYSNVLLFVCCFKCKLMISLDSWGRFYKKHARSVLILISIDLIIYVKCEEQWGFL